MFGRLNATFRRPVVDLDWNGINRRHVGIEFSRHLLGEAGELKRLEEADEWSSPWRIDGKVADVVLERHMLIERHQPFRYARLLGELDEVLAALLMFELVPSSEQGFEVAIF